MVLITKPDTIEFVQGEKGESYPFFIFNKDGTTPDLTVYTDATFAIISGSDGSELLAPVTLTVNDPNKSVDWFMLAADTDIPDTEADKDHIGIIELTGVGVVRRVHPNPIVKVFKNRVTAFP